MKKIVSLLGLLMLLVITSSGLSARDLYLAGNGNGWAKQDAYKFSQSGEVYSLTVPSSSFSEWKLWDGETKPKADNPNETEWNYSIGKSGDGNPTPGANPSWIAGNTDNGANFNVSLQQGDIIEVKINSSNSSDVKIRIVRGGSTQGGDDTTAPKAWIISQNVNSWSNGSISSAVFSYDASSDLYTITVSPDKLRSDNNNGFKIGYDTTGDWKKIWGTNQEGDLANGTAKSAAMGDATKNFYLPASASGDITLVFNKKGGTLTATWNGGGNNDNPDNPVSGDWTNSMVTASNTLPRLYLTVEDHSIMSRNLADKETRTGSYYLVDKDGTPLMGSEDAQLAMTIKARGNFTRTGFSKKPFKLKLDKTKSLLGLSESKHYALLTHADDQKGYLTNFVGFWLGNNIFPNGDDIAPGHAKVFTPKEKPVELYINGVYWGLYFLTESIRVESTRINIPELADNETDPALLSGGYLVELDNYPDPNQITMKEGGKNSDSEILRITPDTPELYSDAQRRFVTEQFTKMNDLVGSSSDELWKYMDIDMAARYYVVMEILCHWEAYHGSTYMYRDRGEGQKWMFSPLWDCGHALEHSEGWLTDKATYGNTWIGKMKENAQFMNKVVETYKWFWANRTSALYSDMEAYVKAIEAAAKKDHERWGNEPLPNQYDDPLNNNYATNPTAVYDNSGLVGKFSEYKKVLTDRINWLNNQWGTPSTSYGEPTWNTIEAAPLPDYVKEGYDPTKVVVPEDAAGVYPVFFKDELNESTIKAYVYGNDQEPCGKWSGQACDKVTINNVEYWYTIVNANTDSSNWRIIFNNGDKSQWPSGNNVEGYSLVKRGVYGTGGYDNKTIAAGTYSSQNTEPDNPVDPWEGRNPDAEIGQCSGTIPVLYIMTDDANYNLANITKETYVTGKYWLDPKGDGNVEAVGSRAEALPLKFKGRGNYTFSGFDKKPYKLKLDEKQKLCSLKKHKEFGLLAHADDNKAFLRNTAGFWLSKQIGLPWTPDQYPVEVMVNGKYQGMYLLTDLIAIDKNRVNIQEWVEEVVNEDGSKTKLSKWQEGGSLVEIDNYPDDDEMNAGRYGENQIHYKDCDNEWMRITYDKSVEAPYVPDGYETWLKGQFTKMDELIGKHSSEIWNYLDLDDCAKFIIVQDIVGNYESFHGSCYLHRQYGEGNKWHFSPVWDFGSAFNGNSRTNAHFWDCAEYHNHWIKHLVQIPEMQAKLAELYTAFNADKLGDLDQYLEDFISKITQAAAKDKARWPQYGNDNLSGKLGEVKSFLSAKRNYLAGEWKPEVVDPPVAPNAWVISKKINDWGTENITNQQLSYDAIHDVYFGDFEVSQLRADNRADDGFKIGYGVYSNDFKFAGSSSFDGEDWSANDNNFNRTLSYEAAGVDGYESGAIRLPEEARGMVYFEFRPHKDSAELTASWQTANGFVKGLTYYFDISKATDDSNKDLNLYVNIANRNVECVYDGNNVPCFEAPANAPTILLFRGTGTIGDAIVDRIENIGGPDQLYSKPMYYVTPGFNEGYWKEYEAPEIIPDPVEPTAHTLIAGNTYYIDASKCSYFFGDSAREFVYDGNKEVEVTVVYGSLVSFIPTVNTTAITIRRYKSDKSALWNHMDNIPAPEDPETDNMFVFNSGFNEYGSVNGQWQPYVVPTKNTHTIVFIDRHSTPWEEVYAYVWKNGEQELGKWPGTKMTKKLNAPSKNRAESNGTTWTHSFDSWNDANDINLIFNNGKAENAGKEQTVDTKVQENTAHVRSGSTGSDGKYLLDTEEYSNPISGIEVVGAEGYSVTVMNGMLVVNSDIATMLQIVTVEGRVMMVEITPGVTMIGLDRGVYIVNGRKYAI